MNIQILVVGFESEIDKQTKESLKTAGVEENKYSYLQYESQESSVINSYVKSRLSTKEEYILLIPNKSIIAENYFSVVSLYVKEEAVYLPLVIVEGEDKKLNGILNSIIWHSSIAQETGKLNFDTAIKQVDLTIFGCLIPLKLLKENLLVEDISFYYHFDFLNKITKEDYPCFGIPKTLVTINYNYNQIPDNDKRELFRKTQEKYTK